MSQLRIEGLEKRFGRVIALDELGLEVERAELLLILGPSGCGKATLLRSIAGLEHMAMLPMFGPLFMGYKDRRRFIAPDLRGRLLLPGGFVAATLLVRGQIRGSWQHKQTGVRLQVRLTLFEPEPDWVVKKAEQRLQALAPALGASRVTIDLGLLQEKGSKNGNRRRHQAW